MTSTTSEISETVKTKRKPTRPRRYASQKSARLSKKAEKNVLMVQKVHRLESFSSALRYALEELLPPYDEKTFRQRRESA